jgi:hypothetical protein
MTDKREKISEHITLAEAMASSTAERLQIDNNPPDDIKEVMKRTAEAVFEPARNHFGCRIAVTSFFRCDELNAALSKDPKILASKKSQHRLGEAMDLNAEVFGGLKNSELFTYIRENCEFDQLIWENVDNDPEPEWVHVSFKSSEGAKNRKEVLKRFTENGKTRYEKL